MNSRVERKTVDLSAFPDLVVIYLGMRVIALTGVRLSRRPLKRTGCARSSKINLRRASNRSHQYLPSAHSKRLKLGRAISDLCGEILGSAVT